MAIASPLRQPNISQDSVIAQVRRQLGTDREDGLIAACDKTVEDQLVTTTVEDLWSTSRIKTYVPILALRRVRDEIQATAGRR